MIELKSNFKNCTALVVPTEGNPQVKCKTRFSDRQRL